MWKKERQSPVTSRTRVDNEGKAIIKRRNRLLKKGRDGKR